MKTLEEAIAAIKQLTKELSELRKDVKPLLIERQFKKQHKKRKELGEYD